MSKICIFFEKESFIFTKIKKLKIIKVTILSGVLFLLGVFINFVCPFPFFYVHLISLLTIFIISLYTVKKFMLFFENGLTPLNPQITGAHFRTEKKLKSNLNLYIACIVVVFYFVNIILLKYIQMNSMGVYAIIVGAVALFFSIIGYFQFVQLIIYTKRITKLDISDYNKFIPANTPWLVIIAEQAKNFKNIFFILGLLFTFEYAMLVPKNSVSFKPNLSINVNPNFSFIITWGGIILFIIIAFPVYSYLLKAYIKKIVSKLKQQRIEELEKLLEKEMELSNGLGDILIEKTSTVAALIKQVNDSQNYPIKDSSSFNILLPLLTLAVHLTSIATGLKTLL
ncbi:hypothetical protein [Paenibacillus sp. HW567]|uniref:hypothetical protein n=1 Tax=Paenibacillus sp. HW567 TaxID=1034769 RepID=UPI0012EC9543|nr:hypothetical protein [Paenibacillus sp. HW567]